MVYINYSAPSESGNARREFHYRRDIVGKTLGRRRLSSSTFPIFFLEKQRERERLRGTDFVRGITITSSALAPYVHTVSLYASAINLVRLKLHDERHRRTRCTTVLASSCTMAVIDLAPSYRNDTATPSNSSVLLSGSGSVEASVRRYGHIVRGSKTRTRARGSPVRMIRVRDILPSVTAEFAESSRVVNAEWNDQDAAARPSYIRLSSAGRLLTAVAFPKVGVSNPDTEDRGREETVCVMSGHERTSESAAKLVGSRSYIPFTILSAMGTSHRRERERESLLVSRILANSSERRLLLPAVSGSLIPPGRRITRPSAYDFIRGSNWLSYSPSDHEHGASE